MSDATESAAKNDQSVELAKLRSSLAIERTMLAWIRTALTLIGFGFTLTKFMHDMLKSGNFDTTMHYPRELGIGMMTLGIIGLTGGLYDYRHRLKRVHDGSEAHVWTASFMVAVVLVALSVYTLFSLIAGIYL